MRLSKLERQRKIFLAARSVFVGENARIRDHKTVMKLVTEQETVFEPILKTIPKANIVNTIVALLGRRVFESEVKAKDAFPELMEVSPARGLQHDISEQDAARSEAEALKKATRLDADISGVELRPPTTGKHKSATDKKNTVVEAELPHLSITNAPSLFPSYLTYDVQHVLLNIVQRLLERCCFDFAIKWIPAVLEERNWTCAEAAELLRWLEVLPAHFDKFPADSTTLSSGDDLATVLRSTHALRHAAVHRFPTSAKGVEVMLQKAIELAKALKDTPLSLRLEKLALDFSTRMKALEMHKNHLENRLDADLRTIEEERAALSAREREAKTTTLRADRDNTVQISAQFAEAVAQLEAYEEHLIWTDRQETPAENVGEERDDEEAAPQDHAVDLVPSEERHVGKETAQHDLIGPGPIELEHTNEAPAAQILVTWSPRGQVQEAAAQSHAALDPNKEEHINEASVTRLREFSYLDEAARTHEAPAAKNLDLSEEASIDERSATQHHATLDPNGREHAAEASTAQHHVDSDSPSEGEHGVEAPAVHDHVGADPNGEVRPQSWLSRFAWWSSANRTEARRPESER